MDITATPSSDQRNEFARWCQSSPENPPSDCTNTIRPENSAPSQEPHDDNLSETRDLQEPCVAQQFPPQNLCFLGQRKRAHS